MPFITTPATTTLYDRAAAVLGITDPDSPEGRYLAFCCEAAESTIKHYRNQDITAELEAEYYPLAVEMALYLYNKQGLEGVVSYSENGASFSFESGSFPSSMLARITLPVRSA